MTDITDQDRRMALAFAREIGNLVSPHTGAAAAARIILATVDATEPTLAEELRDTARWWRDGAPTWEQCCDRFDSLADRAEQIEQERDYWKDYALDRQREVERLTAERGAATVAPEENVAADQQANTQGTLSGSLPNPADVKPGEAWLVQVEGKAVAALRIGNGRWVTASGTGFYVWTHGVERLVSSLVPEVTA